eukprot:gene2756-4401_t
MLIWYYDKLKAAGVVADILKLIYNCTEATDPDVALAACEFWGDLVNHHGGRAASPQVGPSGVAPAASARPDGTHTAVQDLTAAGMLHQLIEQLLNKM